MTAGLTLSERQALRRRYRERAIASATVMGLTIRCQALLDDLDDPDHRLCRGESRDGAGCLCKCHDNQGAVIVSREDQCVP